MTTCVVLIKQNRLAEQRAHLDLEVTLLTEQKAAKLIDLLEELRRDLSNVKNRDDPEAVAPQTVIAIGASWMTSATSFADKERFPLSPKVS